MYLQLELMFGYLIQCLIHFSLPSSAMKMWNILGRSLSHDILKIRFTLQLYRQNLKLISNNNHIPDQHHTFTCHKLFDRKVRDRKEPTFTVFILLYCLPDIQ